MGGTTSIISPSQYTHGGQARRRAGHSLYLALPRLNLVPLAVVLSIDVGAAPASCRVASTGICFLALPCAVLEKMPVVRVVGHHRPDLAQPAGPTGIDVRPVVAKQASVVGYSINRVDQWNGASIPQRVLEVPCGPARAISALGCEHNAVTRASVERKLCRCVLVVADMLQANALLSPDLVLVVAASAVRLHRQLTLEQSIHETHARGLRGMHVSTHMPHANVAPTHGFIRQLPTLALHVARCEHRVPRKRAGRRAFEAKKTRENPSAAANPMCGVILCVMSKLNVASLPEGNSGCRSLIHAWYTWMASGCAWLLRLAVLYSVRQVALNLPRSEWRLSP